jgi:hypothetical protein
MTNSFENTTPIRRNFGFTFGRTQEGRDRDYEALEKRLAEEERARNNPAQPTPIVTPDDNPVQVAPTKGWLYVPSVGLEFSPNLEGLGSNWYDCHKLAKSKNLIMPSINETWALFFFAKAHLQELSFRKIYEYFTKKTPVNTWHGEWQDAFFKEENKKMFMYRFKGLNSKGEPEFQNPVDITGSYLSSDCYVNITQKSNINQFGMPHVGDSRNNYVEGENFYGWYPRNGAVAGFGANSGRAYLSCGRGPTSSYASFGVRFARRLAPSVSTLQNSGGTK